MVGRLCKVLGPMVGPCTLVAGYWVFLRRLSQTPFFVDSDPVIPRPLGFVSHHPFVDESAAVCAQECMQVNNDYKNYNGWQIVLSGISLGIWVDLHW